jgi:hypothetical protein
MFWVWIVIAVLVIVGATVLAAKLVSSGGERRVTPERQQQITALKASGALRHRKSNQP